ncbi:hypothetical protein [Azospirillum sp.]|uniref:hypothetical protein n=1 Tax=Azospirillum sp. TaxID=34012 RepID=UPI003D71185B
MGGPHEGAPTGSLGPVDLWPAVLWIAAGIYAFAGAPALFTWWKGVAYFLVGSPVMLLVTGTATARLRRAVVEMVTDVFPQRDRLTDAVLVMLRGLLAVIEAMLVLFAASGTLQLLG